MTQMRSAQQDRFVDIVGDEQHCGAKRLPDIEQQLLHRQPRLCIERAERLIHQEGARAHHQYAGDADALAHAAGQLRRQRIGKCFKPTSLSIARAFVSYSSRAQALHARTEDDVVPNIEPRKQRRLLKHHAAVGPWLARFARHRTTIRRRTASRSRRARLSRVDLPQPDGPSSATNSPSLMSRVMSSSACTGTLPGNVFDMARKEIVPMTVYAWNDCMRRQPSAQLSSRMIRRSLRKPEQPDRGHVGDDDVHSADVIGIPQHVAEAGFHRDHLRDDDGGPADAEADPQPGENRWQRSRQHHAAQHVQRLGAHHQRGADRVLVDVARALRRC